MSDLGTNDLILNVNKRLIRNLAISRDHQFKDSVTLAVQLLDLAAAFDSDLANWLNRGLEHPIEATSNLQMLVPRLLYATSNNAWNSTPQGNTDLERLMNRLRQYDDIAPGPNAATLPANATIADTPLDNPCPVVFRRDPDRRFSFLRDHFFSNNEASFLEVTNQGLVMTITGQAHRGDLFTRDRAANHPTHTFTMKLRFNVVFINDSDINFGPVPFQMITDPPPPTTAGAPSLPANGSFVFARRFANGAFVLPTLVPSEDDPNILVQPRNLAGSLFNGQLDDQIYESSEGMPFDPIPVYRVEPRSTAEPQRFVIRKIGDPNILAEARAGRLALQFDSMVSLEMTPDDVTNTEKQIIGASLSKINPTLAQVFTCDDIQGDMNLPLNLFNLLGPAGLDIPIMPRSVVVPTEANVVTVDNNLPGPLNSVASNVTVVDLDTAKFFPHNDEDKQAFAVAGAINGNGSSSFNDFNAGSDFSVGISQNFMQPMLDEAGVGVLQSIKDDPPEGLDQNSLQFNADIGDGKLVIRVTGDGTIVMPFFLPDIDYDFSAIVALSFRAQKAVVIDGSGHPLNRFHCQIFQEALDAFGLNVAANRLELPNDSASESTPDRNPLSFLGYNDPHDGIACFDNCTAVERIPPIWYDQAVNEVVVDDPDNPPTQSGCEQRADDPQRLSQASFYESLNPDLKHEWVIAPVTPTDDDVDVNVNIDILAIFLGGFVISFLSIFILGPIVPIILISGLFLLPFTNVIVSAIATDSVVDKLAERNLPSVDADLNFVSFLAIHLEDPNVRPSFSLQTKVNNDPGAFITRYHVVIQSATTPDGG